MHRFELLKGKAPTLVMFALCVLQFLRGTWQDVVVLLGAMATHAVCVILVKVSAESKELTELRAAVEVASKKINALNLKLGFK